MDQITTLPPDKVRVSASTGFTTVTVTGADRREFLQGQLTQDLDRASAEHSPLTGWASAKGRLLATGPVISWQDGIHLVLPAAIAGTIANRLRMFVLRAAAEISIDRYALLGLTARDGTAVNVANGSLGDAFGATADYTDYCIARHNADRSRAWLIAPARSIDGLGDIRHVTIDDRADQWTLADVRAGYPVIQPSTSEAFVPQMVNLDLLDAISFTKGCYVGQEIVARTQNLGRIKRRMYRFSTMVDDIPEPGQLLHTESGATGKVVCGASNGERAELLAVVPIADIAKAWFADKSGKQELRLETLPYEIPA